MVSQCPMALTQETERGIAFIYVFASWHGMLVSSILSGKNPVIYRKLLLK
jgi:hypothetical protein